MRFYLDENLSQEIAILARARGLDVVSGHELGHDGWSDEQQLAFAAAEGRCLVTADVKDFTRLSREWSAGGLPHSGVLCLPTPPARHQLTRAVAALARAHAEYPEGVPAYFVDYLR